MEIKAKLTVDKKYVMQAYKALYGRKLSIIAVIGLLGLTLCLWALIRGSSMAVFLRVCAALFTVYLITPLLLTAFFTWAIKKGKEGERELTFNEAGIQLKNLKCGTEAGYSMEQISGVMRRREVVFLLIGKKYLMVRPEYFETGGYEEFLQWLRRLNKTADIYDRKSLACKSYTAKKRAVVTGGMELTLKLLAVCWLLALLVNGVAEGQKCGRVFAVQPVIAAWWMLLPTLLFTLYRPIKRCLLGKGAESLHDLCLIQYRLFLSTARDRKLLTMALCRLSAGQSQYAGMALDKIRPEKLSRKRQALYEQARTMPESGKAGALLQESRRLDRRKGRLITLSCWIITLALFVLTYLQA